MIVAYVMAFLVASMIIVVMLCAFFASKNKFDILLTIVMFLSLILFAEFMTYYRHAIYGLFCLIIQHYIKSTAILLIFSIFSLFAISIYGRYNPENNKHQNKVQNQKGKIAESTCCVQNGVVEISKENLDCNNINIDNCSEDKVTDAEIREFVKDGIFEFSELFISRFDTCFIERNGIYIKSSLKKNAEIENVDNNSSEREHDPVKKGIILKIVYNDEQAAVNERESNGCGEN